MHGAQSGRSTSLGGRRGVVEKDNMVSRRFGVRNIHAPVVIEITDDWRIYRLRCGRERKKFVGRKTAISILADNADRIVRAVFCLIDKVVIAIIVQVGDKRSP